jgi:hypothetical protein
LDDFTSTGPDLPGGDVGSGGIDRPSDVPRPATPATDPASQPGNVGDALGHDLSNLGSDVPAASDRTFPDPQVGDKTF